MFGLLLQRERDLGEVIYNLTINIKVHQKKFEDKPLMSA